MLALTLALSMQLGAADVHAEAWVVVSRRSGVARPQALEFARSVATALNERGVPTPIAPEDASSCNAKVPCLVDLAQKKNVGVLITVEAGSALDDMVLHVEALSVEEFGKKLATFDFTGPANGFQADLKNKIEEFFAPAVRNVLGIGATAKKEPAPTPAPPVEKKPEPEPAPVAEKPVEEQAAPPAAVAVEEKPSSGMGTLQYVGLAGMGVGAVLLATSAGLGIKTLSTAGQKNALCPAGMQCSDPQAFQLYNSAAGTQNAGVALLVTGLVVAAAGAVLFFVDFSGTEHVDPGGKGENPGLTIAPVISPQQAGLSLAGRF